jgi:hypothetical protein
MPYILTCPTTVASFIEMVGRYALPSAAPTKVKTLLERINASNSVHLPSKTAGTTNREKIGRLCAIVLHYLVSMGQTNPDLFPPAEHIQAVLSALFALARDVPMAAGEAFRAALHRVFLQCVEGVHPKDEADRTRLRRRWPTVGELIMLRATSLLFPVTDFRHPVTTPFALLLGALLAGGTHHSGCGPVRTAVDFAKALFLAELQLDVAKKTKRLAPESVNFCSAAVARLVLDTRSDVGGDAEEGGGDAKKAPRKSQKKRRRVRAAQVTQSAEMLVSRVPIFAAGSGSVDFLAVCRVALKEEKKAKKEKAKKEEDGEEDEDEGEATEGARQDKETGGEVDNATSSPLACMPSKLVPLKSLLPPTTTTGKKKDRAFLLPCGSVLTALFALLERASDQFNTNVALPEMFADGLPCLRALLRTKDRLVLPRAVERRAARTVARVVENVAAAVEMRVPCRMQARMRRAVPIRQQRPMFDENYIVRKDNDPDKERAELRSLKRKIKREQKAVARDLRRDALFVAQEQEKKDRAWEAETQSKYNKAVEFVNQQHAEAKAVQREGVAHGGGMVAGRRFKRSRHAK